MAAPETDTVKGAIKLEGLLESKCFSSWQELIKALPDMLSVEIPGSITNVIVGNTQPKDDQRDYLWVRKDNSGSFIGLYVYSAGKWQQVVPAPGQVTWAFGDSREVPAGYALVQPGNSHFSDSEAATIMQQYIKHSSGAYYTYFALTFEGF